MPACSLVIAALVPTGTIVPFQAVTSEFTVQGTNPQLRCQSMGRRTQVFAQPFADIWQFSPFHPSVQVAEFLQQFMRSGQFDADRFWAFVAESGPLPIRQRVTTGRRGNG